MPVVKIDRSFVQGLTATPGEGAIIGLSHVPGLIVVAKGVETPSNWNPSPWMHSSSKGQASPETGHVIRGREPPGGPRKQGKPRMPARLIMPPVGLPLWPRRPASLSGIQPRFRDLADDLDRLSPRLRSAWADQEACSIPFRARAAEHVRPSNLLHGGRCLIAPYASRYLDSDVEHGRHR